MEQQGRWQDGQPKDDPKKTVVFGAGDGTVPEESARWPADDTSQGYTWARIVADYSDAKHSGLIGSYLTEITSFLESGEAPQGKVLIAAQATPLAASGTLNELTLSTRGTVRLDVVDPSGNHTGVLSATGEAAQQIPNSEMQFEMDSGGIKIENPVDGTYQVTIFGAANRDFQLDVGYGGSDFAEDKQLSGFMKSSTIAFDLIINTQTSPHLTVVPAVLPPETVQANPDTAGTNTIISWQLRPDADVTGYAIYSAGNTDPYFAQIGTVAATVASFQTSDLWAGSNAIAPKTYAVTALNNNGSESFLSVRVQNNDRDHDHLTDADEAAFGTDPTKPDTDDDTFSDYDEINAGSDPLLPSSVPAGSVKTLADAILYLRVLAGLHPDSGIAVEIDDINQDGRIGMEEVISTLRHLAQTP